MRRFTLCYQQLNLKVKAMKYLIGNLANKGFVFEVNPYRSGPIPHLNRLRGGGRFYPLYLGSLANNESRILCPTPRSVRVKHLVKDKYVVSIVFQNSFRYITNNNGE